MTFSEVYLDSEVFRVNLGVDLFEVCVWRNDAFLERHNHLDQTSQPTGPFEVADVGLECATNQNLPVSNYFSHLW